MKNTIIILSAMLLFTMGMSSGFLYNICKVQNIMIEHNDHIENCDALGGNFDYKNNICNLRWD